ncbi:MAG: spore germination protein [Clostridia bacterium]|nr:spore germination protein [Clostridia bacterium]
MIGRLIRKIKYYSLQQSNSIENNKKNSLEDNKLDEIPKSINDLTNKLEAALNQSSDFNMRKIAVGREKPVNILIAFIDGLVNKELVNADILRPLMLETNSVEIRCKNTLELIKTRFISSCEINDIFDFKQALDAIVTGDTVIFVENESQAVKVNLRNWDKRSVEEPPSDAVIRGPREGFTESIRTNTALIRRKIKNTNLKFETIKIGKQTNTDISICYIKGIAHEEIVQNVKQKIREINMDAVLESAYIEEYIEESTFSIFPTVGNSEKPDIVASKILEGRVAILCDGTPFVLTVPYLFVEAIQSSEDYYNRSIYSIISRLIRVLAVIITTMLPGFYVALVCFHQDIIPYKLLLTMTASKEGIPFSPIVEASIMIITFELLREAGVRMPRAIGQAVSIVGALVIGDAAVKAGLVSSPMVIVIAITAITSFIVPSLAGSLLIMRLAVVFAANVIGILGIFLVSLVFFIHMCSLKSYGVNYLSPITPVHSTDLKDTFVRFPLWAMMTRPKALVGGQGRNAKYRNK